jgi:hypothetical protein
MKVSKINKVARFTLNSTIALGYYSPTTYEEAIAMLMEKDIIKPQKEKVKKLITFEKEKFEENMEISNDDLEYEKEYKEMFKNEENKELVKKRKSKANHKIEFFFFFNSFDFHICILFHPTVLFIYWFLIYLFNSFVVFLCIPFCIYIVKLAFCVLRHHSVIYLFI